MAAKVYLNQEESSLLLDESVVTPGFRRRQGSV